MIEAWGGQQAVARVSVMKPPLKNPEHWEMRAEEAKAVAELLKDPASRIEMLRIAEGYGRLAERSRKSIT